MEEQKQKVKRELLLEGLDCANCAQKIEDGVKGIEGVTSCSVNYMTKTLMMETDDTQEDEVVSEATKIVKRLEPHVNVQEKRSPKRVASVRTFYLQGLDCANCAAKIERGVGKLDGVTSASLDFVSKKLVMEAANSDDLDWLENEATKIVKKLEPEVEVMVESYDSERRDEHGHSHDHGSAQMKKMVVRLGIGAVLAGFGMFAPVSSMVELGLFLIAYLIIGGDIVLRAVKNILRGQVFDEHFLMALATIGAFAIKEYPEGVAVMLFYQVGELFQSMAVNRSRKSISALMDIRPD